MCKVQTKACDVNTGVSVITRMFPLLRPLPFRTQAATLRHAAAPWQKELKKDLPWSRSKSRCHCFSTEDVAMMFVQEKRRVVPVPGGSLACQNVTFFESDQNLNLVSQTRVVSQDEQTVFCQPDANHMEPMSDDKQIVSLMDVLACSNRHPWSAIRQILHQSDLRVLRNWFRVMSNGQALPVKSCKCAKKLDQFL
jgi:hypothetical protein